MGDEGEGTERGGDNNGGHYHHHCCEHLLAGWMGDGGEMRGRRDRGGKEDDATCPTKHPQPLPQAIACGVERGAT